MNVYVTFLISLLLEGSKSQLNLTLFHNTDMYSRFEETFDHKSEKMIGGFSRLSQTLEAARKESSTPVLYLNAGNTFTGTYLYHIYRWKIVAKMMNALNPDAVALGSQEFVDGLYGLEPFLDTINFPVVASNIIAKNGTIFSKKVHASIVLHISNVSIGIIGYTSRGTQKKYPVGSLQFTDELEAVQKECERLNELNVTIVFGLGNADFATDLDIAKKAECLDVVVGGVSKQSRSYPMEIKNANGKMVLLLEGYSKVRYVGKTELAFDSKGNLESFAGNPILLDEEVSKRDKIGPLLKDFGIPAEKIAASKLGKQILGRSKVYLSADKCREQECNLGNMVVDALIEYKAAKYTGVYWSDTPIAIMNAGGIRRSINATKNGHNIILKDVVVCVPYRQPLVTIVLSGADLKYCLEVGARYNGETRRGEFLMVSGIRVIFDFKRPPFDRVISVLVRCGQCKTPSYGPLDSNEYYRVVTTVFIANGGDGHSIIRKASLSFELEGFTEQAATISYIQTYNEVRPECDERIVHMRYLTSHQGTIRFDTDGSELLFVLLIIINIIYIFLSVNSLFY